MDGCGEVGGNSAYFIVYCVTCEGIFSVLSAEPISKCFCCGSPATPLDLDKPETIECPKCHKHDLEVSITEVWD